MIAVTSTAVATVALTACLIFGIGAWTGQSYDNKYARKSYELSLWSICADHEVSEEAVFVWSASEADLWSVEYPTT